MKVSQTVLAAVLVLIIAASSSFTGYYIGKSQARERGFERFHKLREYGEKHPEQFKKMMEHRRG
ncbi:MAG: hypothetical protein PHR22_01850, partial [Candidatus Omnitrophica bacterium]|nr:hypothetical protein [Candidatus Omnitrophota bacterium]